jgi:putative ABC transport system permease protein
MFRNYLAAALRNLVRNRLYAAINVIGLAVGFAAALLIALFVRDELTYDRWIPDHERVVMVSSKWTFPNFVDDLGMAPSFAAEMLKQEFPEIESIARLSGMPMSVRNGDVEAREQTYWADASFFDVVKLPVLSGNLATALRGPETVVLTRSAALKYFGTVDVVGRTLEFKRQYNLRITAVLADLPSNTHLDLTIIGSGTSALSPLKEFDAHPVPLTDLAKIAYTYARLKDPAAITALRRALPDFVARHPEFHRVNAEGVLDVLPISAVHLRRGYSFAMTPAGDATRAYGFLAIAALIVVMAGLNFVNLTTILSARRATEVGVRKVSGAERRHLVSQFLAETLAHVALAMALGAMIAALLLPSFDAFLKRTIAFPVGDVAFVGELTVATLILGLMAGAYPAFVLSGGVPAKVLKGARTAEGRGGLRHLLTTVQFAILVCLGLIATVISAQERFATREGLRFATDQVLEITVPCVSSFATTVRTVPGVVAAACARTSILLSRGTAVPLPAMSYEGHAINPAPFVVDFGFFELFGLKPLAGRFFSRSFGADAAPARGDGQPPAIVINESMVRALGFATPEDAIGKSIRWQRQISAQRLEYTAPGPSEIIGVAPDFARGSIRERIPPQIFWVDPGLDFAIYLKIDGAHVPETLAAIDRLTRQVDEPRPIARRFLDQGVQDLYLDLTRQAQVLAALAIVAVFVAALGLFGVAALAAERRTKEIGVRKVLGASRRDILRLLLWQFSKPVLLANLIAWPAAYVIAHRWLDGFAYHITLAPRMFLAASASALVIAVLTVAGHALLVARAEPATALRYE